MLDGALAGVLSFCSHLGAGTAPPGRDNLFYLSRPISLTRHRKVGGYFFDDRCSIFSRPVPDGVKNFLQRFEDTDDTQLISNSLEYFRKQLLPKIINRLLIMRRYPTIPLKVGSTGFVLDLTHE